MFKCAKVCKKNIDYVFPKAIRKLAFSKRSFLLLVFVVTHYAFQLKKFIQLIGQFVDYVGASNSM